MAVHDRTVSVQHMVVLNKEKTNNFIATNLSSVSNDCCVTINGANLTPVYHQEFYKSRNVDSNIHSCIACASNTNTQVS